MTEKMRTSEMPSYSAVPFFGISFSEQSKDCVFASGCVAALAMVAYSIVSILLARTRDPTRDIEVIGYVLIILGYLLLPGVGVLLVRRRRCLARNRVLLMAETDIADSLVTDAFGGRAPLNRNIFGKRQIMRVVEAATKCVIWGAADDKEEQCSVCLNNVELGSEVRVLPCSHVYHRQCADLWLVNGRKNSCPMCMQRVCEDRGPDMMPIRSER